MAKIASAILILREAKSVYWTSELDKGMISWTKSYIAWVTTNSIAHEEQVSAKCVVNFLGNKLVFNAAILQQPWHILL